MKTMLGTGNWEQTDCGLWSVVDHMKDEARREQFCFGLVCLPPPPSDSQQGRSTPAFDDAGESEARTKVVGLLALADQARKQNMLVRSFITSSRTAAPQPLPSAAFSTPWG